MNNEIITQTLSVACPWCRDLFFVRITIGAVNQHGSEPGIRRTGINVRRTMAEFHECVDPTTARTTQP